VIASPSIGRAGGDVTIFAISTLRSAIDPAAIAGIWRRLTNGIFDRYRPELHYMRGPGPKWHEKHARAQRKASSPR
jgi:hypothetical protein